MRKTQYSNLNNYDGINEEISPIVNFDNKAKGKGLKSEFKDTEGTNIINNNEYPLSISKCNSTLFQSNIDELSDQLKISDPHYDTDKNFESNVDNERLLYAYNVRKRLSPFLNNAQQEDLYNSIEIIKSWKRKEEITEPKLSSLSVSLSQGKQIFKFIKDTLQNIKNEDEIEYDTTLQSNIALSISNILKDDLGNIKYEFSSDSNDFNESKSQTQIVSNAKLNSINEFYDTFKNDIQLFIEDVYSKKLKLINSKKELISKIKLISSSINHIKSWEIYGSYQTNLDLPWSDIDFVISS